MAKTRVKATRVDIGNYQFCDGDTLVVGAAGEFTSTHLPTKVSDLTNDCNYVTDSGLSSAVSGKADTTYVDCCLSTKQDCGDYALNCDLTSGLNSKQDVIADLSTIRSNACCGKAASNTIACYGDIVTHNVCEFQEAGDYATNTTLSNCLACKQDNIADLETIRTNACCGKSAHTTIGTYGNIVTHNVCEFQEAGDYALNCTMNACLSCKYDASNPCCYQTQTEVACTVAPKADKSYVDCCLCDVDARISELQGRGKFLSNWNTTTGKPETDPESMPYTYHAGDYYVVSVTGATNYKPTGSSYTGTASTSVETGEVEVGDIYSYDGTSWLLQMNHGKSVSFSNLSGVPSDNACLCTELAGKQPTISDLSTIRSNACCGKAAHTTISGYGNIVTHNTCEFQEAGDYVLTCTMNNCLACKQDNIADLSDIRTNACCGADAKTTIGTYGDIVTHNVCEFQPTGSYVTTTTLSNCLACKQDNITDLSDIRSNACSGKDASNTIGTYGDIVTHNVCEFQTAGSYAQCCDLTSGLGTKVDKTNCLNKLYGTDGSGSQSLYTYSEADTASSIAKRASDGTLTVSAPTCNCHAATKKYVDDKISGITTSWGEIQGTLSCQGDLKNALDGKQDTISDLQTIRSNACCGATAVQPGDLCAVATSGKYCDLTGTPDTVTGGTAIGVSAGAVSACYDNSTIKVNNSNQLYADYTGLQLTCNLVTSLSNADNDHYPSAKVVADAVESMSGGNMIKEIYDPNNIRADIYNMDYMVDGSTNKVVTACEKEIWCGKQDALTLPSTPTSGHLVVWGENKKTLVDGGEIPNSAQWGCITGTLCNQTDLQGILDCKANYSAIPTDNCQLANSCGYTTCTGTLVSSDLTPYAKSCILCTVATSGKYCDLTGKPSLCTVATSGKYCDLTGTPSIPTDNCELGNSCGYTTCTGTLVSSDLNPYAKTCDLKTVATSGKYCDLTGTPTLGTASSKDTGTSSGNIPVLDSNGKLSTTILPALAITDTFTVASCSCLTTLSSAEKGDVAISTGDSKTYILSADPYSTASNWKELATPTDAVTSVNSKTGAVTLNADDISDTSTTNKFVTSTEKNCWNGKAEVSSIPTDNCQLANSCGYITGINCTNVTTALGYTPYSNANPSGYTTCTGTLVASDLQPYAKSCDLCTVSTSGKYCDLTGKPTIPTNNNQLTNGCGYTTCTGTLVASDLTPYTKSCDLKAVATSGLYCDLSGTPTLCAVATSGKYCDLTGLPTIPTNNNQLTNGCGYTTCTGTLSPTNTGSNGQVLTKTSSGATWCDASGGINNDTAGTTCTLANVWVGTATQYANLSSKSGTTLYLVF